MRPLIPAVLLLAACASPASPAADGDDAPGVKPPPWKVTAISAQVLVRGPAEAASGVTAWSQDVPAGQALVTVRWSLAGTTPSPVAFPGDGELLTGEGWTKAEQARGWMGAQVLRPENRPERVPPSGTMQDWDTWSVPASALAQPLHLRLTGDPLAGEQGELIADVTAR